MSKKWLILVGKIIIVFLLGSAFSTGIRIVSGILQGEHGKPSFLSTGFTIYGAVVELLLIAAFVLLGNQISVKGRITKGLIFVLLFWGSAFLPQLLGMLGGHSANVSEDAFTISTIVSDSLGYVLKGVLFGVFLGVKDKPVKRECTTKRLALTCFISMALFPALLGVMEVVMGFFWPSFYCLNAFMIDRTDTISFYIVFYLFQMVSGLIFPVFYRLTEYNGKPSRMKFISILAFMLWLPVVLILIFFGVDTMVTIAWGVAMVAAIYADGFVFTKLFK